MAAKRIRGKLDVFSVYMVIEFFNPEIRRFSIYADYGQLSE